MPLRKALKLAIAEMYVEGVSTRRAKRITEELLRGAFNSLHLTNCVSNMTAFNKVLNDVRLFLSRPEVCT